MSRTFYDLPTKLPSSESEPLFRGHSLPNSKPLSWKDLLSSRRVLIVSEAGAGKSYECEHKAEELAEQGLPAFFLRLEELHTRPPSQILMEPELGRFHTWLATDGEEAFFFLDSIDELQLTRGSLQNALKRLAGEVGGASQRMTVVVTSRPVEFDRETFRRCLPVAEVVAVLSESEFAEFAAARNGNNKRSTKNVLPPGFREVALAPLSDEEILVLARLHKVGNPEALLEAVKQRNAEDFARRPQDLIELCDDWIRHGEIRPHAQQVRSHVAVRLTQQVNRAEKVSLSLDECHEGAKRLALAVALTKRLAIRYGVASDAVGGDSPVDARKVLTDWPLPNIETLLQRPLFGFGGFGRVRFQHRSTFEYLAAAQLFELLQSGAISLRALKRLLCAKALSGEVVLRPSTAPIAAWLAIRDARVFDFILDVEPSVLLDHGDPESLLPGQRSRALEAYVARYGAGRWRGMHVPALQVKRLASEDLCEVINRLWAGGVENEEVSEVLLQLVSVGRLRGCQELAFNVATDTSYSAGLRFEAFLALGELKDGRLEGALRDVVASGPPQMVRWFLSSLYPASMSTETFIAAIQRLAQQRAPALDVDGPVSSAVRDRTTSAVELRKILPPVAALVWAAKCRFASDYVGSDELPMVRSLQALAARLVGNTDLDNELLDACSLSLATTPWSRSANPEQEVIRGYMAQLDAASRRRAFEADIRIRRELQVVPQSQLIGQLLMEGLLQLNAGQDGMWLAEAVVDTGADDWVRSVALRFFVRLWALDQLDDQALSALRAALAGQDPWLQELERAVAATEPNPEIVAMEKRQRQYEVEASKRAHRERTVWRNFRETLLANPIEAMGDETRATTLHRLSELLEIERRAGYGGRWNRPLLEKLFGKEAVDKIHHELCKIWRSGWPSTRSERPLAEKNEHRRDWDTGLMSLDATAEDPNWAKTLSVKDGERAFRFALAQSHQLASWLPDVIAAHPGLWATMVVREVLSELDEPLPLHGSGSLILHGLRYARPEVGQPVLRPLLNWFLPASLKYLRFPMNAGVFERIDAAIQLLLHHGLPELTHDMADGISTRLPTEATAPFLNFWLPVFARVDPATAVDRLAGLCQGLPAEQDGVAVHLIASAFPSRNSDSAYGVRLQELPPEKLLMLTLLVAEHVLAKHDMRHEGVYSPKPRDNAEDARRNTLNELFSRPGQDGLRIKSQLAQSPLFADMRDRVMHLAREGLATDLDTLNPDDDEVAKLFKAVPEEFTPKSMPELGQLLEDRLDDLQDSMLSDAGHRAAWAEVQLENSLRPSIARELLQASRGAYTVDQESVTADDKERDIRLQTTSNLQATIELKVGEKDRSARDLLATIGEQLVDKYMMAKEAQVGCLVVTVANPKRRWHHPDTNEELDLWGLQKLLEAEARVQQDKLGGLARVMAKVLDLRPRLASEKVTKQAKADSKAAATAPKDPAASSAAQ